MSSLDRPLNNNSILQEAVAAHLTTTEDLKHQLGDEGQVAEALRPSDQYSAESYERRHPYVPT